MSADFDPYHKLLGIPPREQPPHHYRLLGIDLFEDDAEVIEASANRQMSYLQQCAGGPHTDQVQALLNEVSRARVRLLNEEKKAAYDAELRESLGPASSLISPTADAPTAIAPAEDAPSTLRPTMIEPTATEPVTTELPVASPLVKVPSVVAPPVVDSASSQESSPLPPPLPRAAGAAPRQPMIQVASEATSQFGSRNRRIERASSPRPTQDKIKAWVATFLLSATLMALIVVAVFVLGRRDSTEGSTLEGTADDRMATSDDSTESPRPADRSEKTQPARMPTDWQTAAPIIERPFRPDEPEAGKRFQGSNDVPDIEKQRRLRREPAPGQTERPEMPPAVHAAMIALEDGDLESAMRHLERYLREDPEPPWDEFARQTINAASIALSDDRVSEILDGALANMPDEQVKRLAEGKERIAFNDLEFLPPAILKAFRETSERNLPGALERRLRERKPR